MSIVDWWRFLRDENGNLDNEADNTVQTYARRRSILSTEARLRSVLYRSLFELHRMENEDNDAFTTFDLYVNAKDGHVQVLNVDSYGSLGSPYHPPEVFSTFLNRRSFGKVPVFVWFEVGHWRFFAICLAHNLFGHYPKSEGKRGKLCLLC